MNKKVMVLIILTVITISMILTVSNIYAEKHDKKIKHDKKEAHKEVHKDLKIDVIIVNNTSVVEVEDNFKTYTNDKDRIAELILNDINLTSDEIRSMMKLELKHEYSKSEYMRTTIVENDVTHVQFKYRFIINSADLTTLPTLIKERLASITKSSILNSTIIKSESEIEEKLDILKEEFKDIVSFKDIVGKEVAVGFIRVILHPTNKSDDGRGIVKVFFIKINDREVEKVKVDVFSKIVNGNLTVCYDGINIGKMTITKGKTYNHYKLDTNLDKVNVRIPGTSISIVEGNNCTNAPIFNGSF